MGKITLAVCKVYRNGRRFSKHRKKTKPAWKHYFLEEDEPDEYWFRTEWVDSITAQFLKLKKLYKRHFYCLECFSHWTSHVKKGTYEVDCPYCEEE